MEQTFQALESILLKAIPTAILLLVLYFYFKAMLFGPLIRILKQREELTKGARKAAEQSLARAEAKAEEYEAKLRDAKGEVYRDQEETRKKWLAEQAAHLAQAKANAETSIQTARKGIEQEVTVARQGLSETSAAIAEQIANTILARRNS
jgi:F-type H+-transporting ATPase subunit b